MCECRRVCECGCGCESVGVCRCEYVYVGVWESAFVVFENPLISFIGTHPLGSFLCPVTASLSFLSQLPNHSLHTLSHTLPLPLPLSLTHSPSPSTRRGACRCDGEGRGRAQLR